jgi:hypothetical protein
MSSVVSVLRYPLKSAQGQRLDAVDVDRAGLRADRTWACLDAGDGTVVSAKHPRRWGRMLQVGTSLVEDGDEDTLTVHLGGAALAAGTPEADAALSAHLGHEVRLTRIVPEGARLHRLLPGEAGMAPEWMSAVPDEEVITPIAGETGPALPGAGDEARSGRLLRQLRGGAAAGSGPGRAACSLRIM